LPVDSAWNFRRGDKTVLYAQSCLKVGESATRAVNQSSNPKAADREKSKSLTGEMMKHVSLSRIASLATTIILFASLISEAALAQSGFTYTPIVKRGEPAPDGSRFFDCDECIGSISNFNNRGELILNTDTRSYCSDAVVHISGEKKTILLQNDCYKPLAEQFTSSGIAINDTGKMVFGVNKYLDSDFTRRTIFLYSGGEFTPIASESEPTPRGTTFSKSGLAGAHLNNQGDVVFVGYSTDRQGKEGADVFLYANGELRSLVSSGAASPIGGEFSFVRLGSHPQINASGDVLFVSSVPDSTEFSYTDGLFLITREGIKKIVVSHELLPTGVAAEHPVGRLNDKGEIAFSSNTGNRYEEHEAGIYFYANERIQKVMLVGQPAPIGGRFAAFSKAREAYPEPALNNHSAIAFKAAVKNGDSPLAIFLASPKAMLKIVAVGDQIDGAKIADLGEYSLNDEGQLAFYAFDKENKVLGIFKADPVTPEVNKMKLKSKSGRLELRVNGNGLITNDTVIEINGVALDTMIYPEEARESGGTTRQVISRDARLEQLLQSGQPAQITLFNPLTNRRSPVKEFSR
jgi:hypothetical protein